MSRTRILPSILLIVALAVPAAISGQVRYDVSDQKIVSGNQTYYLHLVQKEQTLYSIARTYKVSIDAITANNVIPLNGIQTGQVLRIPESPSMAEAMSKVRQQPPAPVASTKEVQAEKPATPPAQVAEAKAPEPSVKETAAAGPKKDALPEGYRLHKVKKGETLYSLSRDYKVTVEAIIRVNDVPRNEIQIGQVLKIPPSDYETFVKEEDPFEDQAAVKDQAKEPQEEKTSAAAVPQPGVTQPEVREEKPDEAVVKQTQQTQQAQQTEARPPAQPEKKALPVEKKYHKVKKGETLSDIAKKYNVSVKEIKDANDGLLFAMPDMKLVIPVSSAGGETPQK